MSFELVGTYTFTPNDTQVIIGSFSKGNEESTAYGPQFFFNIDDRSIFKSEMNIIWLMVHISFLTLDQ